jgi:hypothetical protein
MHLNNKIARIHDYSLFISLHTKTISWNKMQIDHTWINAPTQRYHVRSTQHYWIDHNLIYLAFKLLDYVPQFILPFTHQTT